MANRLLWYIGLHIRHHPRSLTLSTDNCPQTIQCTSQTTVGQQWLMYWQVVTTSRDSLIGITTIGDVLRWRITMMNYNCITITRWNCYVSVKHGVYRDTWFNMLPWIQVPWPIHMVLFSLKKVQEHMSGPGIIVELIASYRQLFANSKQLSADSCPRKVSGFLDGARHKPGIREKGVSPSQRRWPVYRGTVKSCLTVFFYIFVANFLTPGHIIWFPIHSKQLRFFNLVKRTCEPTMRVNLSFLLWQGP